MFPLLTLTALLFATDPATCPLHEQHMKAAQSKANGDAHHGAEVDGRHDTFGMDHGESHHNFRLYADGGAIELRVNDPQNAELIGVIRTHLRDIAGQFAKADFSTPAFVHSYAPDGVDTMKRLGAKIGYRYEDTPGGGRIRVRTKDAEALAAVHAFMKFQVVEHRTGDKGTVESE